VRPPLFVAVVVALLALPGLAASSSSTKDPTWAEVRAKAPKARTARRAAFLVFARSDRAALVETRGVSCDALEEERLGGPTFVDASRQAASPFSPEEAQAITTCSCCAA